MSVARNFYSTQADACSEAAGNTELPMLREKYERASAAWQALAKRETDIAAARDRRLAETAEKIALNGELSAEPSEMIGVSPSSM